MSQIIWLHEAASYALSDPVLFIILLPQLIAPRLALNMDGPVPGPRLTIDNLRSTASSSTNLLFSIHTQISSGHLQRIGHGDPQRDTRARTSGAKP
jgi:hypothetical protein